MEDSIAIKHAQGNIFVDASDNEVSLSVWTNNGHTRVYLTAEHAKAVVEALMTAIKAVEAA